MLPCNGNRASIEAQREHGTCRHFSCVSVQDKLGRDLTAQAAKLTETVTATSQKVLDSNLRFAQGRLLGFEQEGKYAAATIEQAQQQLQQVEAAVVAVR